MSEPDIYTIKLMGYPEDHYVLWRDYEKLKDELARLRASSFVTAVPVEHYERVVKAGNALRDDLEHLTKSCWFDKCKSVKRWNKVKERK